MTIVAYIPDLMDRSKVQAAAGGAVSFVPSPADLAEAAGDPATQLVVVDLSRPGVLAALPAIAATGVRSVGFGSHVDRALLAEASGAGCSEVMARSSFFGRLAEVLGGLRRDGAGPSQEVGE
ncbi:MAG TPA: hypothetical protein VKI20_06860 [Acidimicrobiales bacterium]|nr:hypothetical protein [Acidimicrobiales bacterium]